jgi:hypothetical protein
MESQDHATNRVAQNALPNASKSSEQSCFEKEKCPCCNPKTQKPPAHHQKRVFCVSLRPVVVPPYALRR